MNKRRFVLILLLFFLSNASFGSDSTLYKLRIAKVKALFTDLAKLPPIRIQSIKDTGLLSTYYVEVLNKHLPHPASGGDYKLAYSAYELHVVSNTLPVDSLLLAYPDPAKDSLADTRSFTYYLANTVILYFPMYGGNWEGAYFSFKEESDELIFLLTAGGDPMDYRRKKEFLNTVRANTGP
ncbi:MAG: hypothetical protein EOP49_10865 [Sphingobacteriales bacterium]|nr:MAG: hypothetical protein EOP49_10865 [Sphingobacteriales bacterium]